ncbi:MAG: ParB N-terminal domain-containing protein [Lachnospiraceae bacterium]|nr:ParB N-terminal domain-containing protein [Lachnospiraceae bacterium]
MSKVHGEIREIKIKDLIPFHSYSSQTYHGERLEQLMDSIERLGQLHPIIVRPIDDEKYEILCGHNRVKAMKALGRNVIIADIRYGLSESEVEEVYYDSNLNQQTFSDWSYSERIKAVKYYEKIIRKNSRQGKRTDLERKKLKDGNETYVQSRQKLDEDSKRDTTRDRMAHSLGISPATFSKYRRIIKISDRLLETIAKFLDQKRISFEVAYRISGWEESDIKLFVEYIGKSRNRKIDMDKFKELCARRKEIELHLPLSKTEFKEILIPEDILLTPRRIK